MSIFAKDIPHWKKMCDKCAGDGDESTDPNIDCDECKGAGIVDKSFSACSVEGCNAECSPGDNLCVYHRETFDVDVHPENRVMTGYAMDIAMQFLKAAIRNPADPQVVDRPAWDDYEPADGEGYEGHMNQYREQEKFIQKLMHQGMSREQAEARYIESLHRSE